MTVEVPMLQVEAEVHHPVVCGAAVVSDRHDHSARLPARHLVLLDASRLALAVPVPASPLHSPPVSHQQSLLAALRLLILMSLAKRLR